jgi:VWFA-related protein
VRQTYKRMPPRNPPDKEKSMNRSLCLLVALAACLGSAFAADENVVFRSDVALVRVDVQVVDRDNRAITGLRVDDFLLREDGKSQQIRNFASENLPLDLLVLLDVSASMRPHVQRIADASRQAMRVLRDDDRVAIMVFDRATRVRLPFRSSRQEVQREFDNLLRQETFRGGTDITGALYDAASYVSTNARRDARRAVVILTDDQTERERDEDGVSRSLARADTVVSALIAPDAMANRSARYPQSGGGMGGGGGLGGIIFGRPRGPYGNRGPNTAGPRTHSAGTSEIARRSGGDSMRVDDAYALEDTLTRIRQRYALHFLLPAGVRAGEERSLSVALNDAALRRYPSAELRYRRMYYVPSGTRYRPPDSEPATISSVPTGTSAGTPSGPRRVAVSQPDGSNSGPLLIPGPASDSQASRPAAAQTSAPPPAANSSDSQSTAPRPGGWRRVKPGEQP